MITWEKPKACQLPPAFVALSLDLSPVRSFEQRKLRVSPEAEHSRTDRDLSEHLLYINIHILILLVTNLVDLLCSLTP